MTNVALIALSVRHYSKIQVTNRLSEIGGLEHWNTGIVEHWNDLGMRRTNNAL